MNFLNSVLRLVMADIGCAVLSAMTWWPVVKWTRATVRKQLRLVLKNAPLIHVPHGFRKAGHPVQSLAAW